MTHQHIGSIYMISLAFSVRPLMFLFLILEKIIKLSLLLIKEIKNLFNLSMDEYNAGPLDFIMNDSLF